MLLFVIYCENPVSLTGIYIFIIFPNKNLIFLGKKAEIEKRHSQIVFNVIRLTFYLSSRCWTMKQLKCYSASGNIHRSGNKMAFTQVKSTYLRKIRMI